MSDDIELTFDDDGFVRMDSLPDVDPDLAVSENAFAGVRDLLHADPLPSSLDAGWDGMLADVDRLDLTDSLALVPNDDLPTGGEDTSGPIVLVDDDGRGDPRPPTGFTPEEIGREDAPATTEPATVGSDASEDAWSPPETDAPADLASDTVWSGSDPLDLLGVDSSNGYQTLEGADDPLDVDVVEIHPDGDNPH